MEQIKSHHPKALPFLFFTEMWERFGFYVIQGLLILYMTKVYDFTDDVSYTILGTFSALVYIAPMIGGIIADRILGFKQAVVWGSILLSIGYAFLALSNSQSFYYALAIIVVGNGLFKPNISSLLGALYPSGSTARDAGFTIFYVGINLGVLLSGLSSGYIKDHFGWGTAFALASVGLIIGLIVFSVGIKWGDMHYKAMFSKINSSWVSEPALLFYAIVTIPVLANLLASDSAGKWLLPGIGIFLLFFVFVLAYQQKPRERNQLVTLNILIIASIIFWMIWMQIFFSANLFIDRLVDKDIFGIPIPTTVFYALESVFVILLGPLFAWTWQVSYKKNRRQSHFIKFVFAIIFVGLGFLTLGISTYFTDIHHFVPPFWIVISYFLITVGELLLSPIGLSAVTILSPAHLTGMMMGIWFVALGFGGAFAGMLAKFSSVPEHVKDAVTQLSIYRHAFMVYATIAFVVALILFIMHFFVKNRLSES